MSECPRKKFIMYVEVAEKVWPSIFLIEFVSALCVLFIRLFEFVLCDDGDDVDVCENVN